MESGRQDANDERTRLDAVTVWTLVTGAAAAFLVIGRFLPRLWGG